MRMWWILALVPTPLIAQESEIHDCAVPDAELERAIAEALKMLEETEPQESDVIFTYVSSAEYGESCGFWFTQELKPDVPGDLIAGPIEVILTKAQWRLVETKYYSHEAPSG